MRFVGRRPAGSTWPRIGLLAVVFALSAALILWGKCSTERGDSEAGKAKVVKRFKIPPRTSVFPSEQAKTGSQKVDKPGGEATGHPSVPQITLSSNGRGSQKGTGYYSTRKGDSLYKIAGLKEVYGDSLKWPSLFRMNMKSLIGTGSAGDQHNKELPEGMVIRFVTAKEARKNLSSIGKKVWVVNVLSSRVSSKIVPKAVKLMRNGYRVYITRHKIKKEKWMRLRAGFFRNRKDANAAATEIKSLLGTEDAWVVKIGKMEQAQFGGY